MAFNIRRILATLSIILVTVVLFGADIYAQPLLPPAASSFADEIDLIFWVILGITTFFFILVFVLLIYFMIRYRAKGPNEEGINFHGHLGLEIAWTIIPAVLFVAIAIYSADILTQMDNPPPDSKEIFVRGYAFKWDYLYVQDDLVTTDELHLVAGAPVRLEIFSTDVLHSFWVPAFRIKQDALPVVQAVAAKEISAPFDNSPQSLLNSLDTRTLWFIPEYLEEEDEELEGFNQFPVICAELCGSGHSTMLGKVVVHETQAGFDQWVLDEKQRQEDEKAGLSESALRGMALAGSKGCIGCHSPDGAAALGPTWLDLWGKTETLDDGTEVLVDEAYLISSVREPNVQIVDGFGAGLMPASGEGQVSDSELQDIIEYIKTLTSGSDGSTASTNDSTPDTTVPPDSSTDDADATNDSTDTGDTTGSSDEPDSTDSSNDGALVDLVSRGHELYTQTCIGCHSIDGSAGLGPSWLGLFGKTQTLSDGQSVTVDEAYIQTAIRDPGADVPEGFPAGIMQPYTETQLSDEDIDAIIEYIKSLTN